LSEEEDMPPPPAPFNPAEQLGAIAPLGYFDPMGFTTVGDEEGFRRLRECELKHGRVAMMASIGLVGQHFIKIPLFGLDKVPSGIGAFFDPTGFGGFFFLLCACGPFELAWRQEEWREPGNYGNPFGIDMYTTDMRNKEISNGRMAMISVVGIWAAEFATGRDAIQQFGFDLPASPAVAEAVTAAATLTPPLSAVAASAEGAIALSEEDMPPPPAPFNPAEQVGAIAPLGYFDPMGFTTVGDEEGFRRLRECELKHGRVAMMASIGLVGQHFIKIPLFGLDKVPSGLGAFFDPTGFGGFFFLL
jgi:hypothetical protein